MSSDPIYDQIMSSSPTSDIVNPTRGIAILDALPHSFYICHTTTDNIPGSSTTRTIYHIDPRTLPILPPRSNASITAFQFTNPYNDHHATRVLREITADDHAQYASIGLQITGEWVLLSTLFDGEVALTTVGWVQVWRGTRYGEVDEGLVWRYLTARDDEIVEILGERMLPVVEVCRTVSVQTAQAVGGGS
ncbi:hypothetical protein TWF696_006220 [Orbilia brochopaga]|uniref:Uncharacterized protein n=1 Tax=Orbilia brochopaga TaxID=3140254 RepID=A0AAV9UVJ7_9PEZI